MAADKTIGASLQATMAQAKFKTGQYTSGYFLTISVRCLGSFTLEEREAINPKKPQMYTKQKLTFYAALILLMFNFFIILQL